MPSKRRFALGVFNLMRRAMLATFRTWLLEDHPDKLDVGAEIMATFAAMHQLAAMTTDGVPSPPR